MEEYIVSNEQANMRIDKAIGLLNSELSRMAIQRLIDGGNILVNDKNTKSSYKTKINDKITIKKEEPKKMDIVAQDIPIEVLYEDDDIIGTVDLSRFNKKSPNNEIKRGKWS